MKLQRMVEKQSFVDDNYGSYTFGPEWKINNGKRDFTLQVLKTLE